MKLLIENRQRRFAVTAAIWGILFMFLILPWQGPDEDSHVDMIGNELGISGLSDILKADMDLDAHRIRWNPNPREIGRIELRQVVGAMFQKPQYTRTECLPKTVSIRIIRHLPAAAGMEAGILLGLPTYWVMIMGRFCTLMTYICLGSIALDLMPVREEILELTMLLPMCMQQAASLNYDGVLLPVSFLFTAYIFYLKYEADKVGLREVLVTAALLLCMAIVKVPYVVMGGMVLLVPAGKIDIPVGSMRITGDILYKGRWLICGVCAAVAAVVTYAGRNNMWIGIVCASVANPTATIRLLRRTWIEWAGDIFESFAGNFGWLDAPVAAWFVAAVVALLVVMSTTRTAESDQSQYAVLSKRDRLIMTLVWMSCFYLIAMSMVAFTADYQSDNWGRTIREIFAISGMQGRYFIPVVPVMMMAMPHLFDMKEKIFARFAAAWYAFACMYTSWVIIWRYWKL